MTTYLSELSARWPATTKTTPVVVHAQAPLAAPVDPDEHLRLDDAARLIGVHKRTIAAWERRGLRLRRVGTRIVLVSRRDLLQFISGGDAEKEVTRG